MKSHQIEAINSIVRLFEGLFRADTEAYALEDEITPNIRDTPSLIGAGS